MTRRDRMERRLALRLEWATGRRTKAGSAFQRAKAIADGIPFGQPILVGHHSERHARADQRRIQSGMAQGVESLTMASHHESKAAGIEAQLERSIYSDDPNAVEALRARIASLEEQRRRMKVINGEIKRGPGWQERLTGKGIEVTPAESDELLGVLKHQPYYCDKKTGLPVFPTYSFSNLTGNIGRLKKRIEAIEARAERTAEAEAAPGGVLITGEAQVKLTFAEKPGREVLLALKAAGFWWNGGSWYGERANLPAEIQP